MGASRGYKPPNLSQVLRPRTRQAGRGGGKRKGEKVSIPRNPPAAAAAVKQRPQPPAVGEVRGE